MGRPGGVTVLAVLDFIGAFFWLLGGVLLLVGSSFIGAALSQGQGGNAAAGGFFAMLGGMASIVFLIIGAIAALNGWGMLTLKSWARIVQMIFAGLGILLSLPALVHFSFVGMIVFLIRVVICGLILWYLLKPEVAAAFNGNQTKAAGA